MLICTRDYLRPMRFYDFEEWLGGLRWYHWLGAVVVFSLAVAVANAMGWLPESPPPGGWHPKE